MAPLDPIVPLLASHEALRSTPELWFDVSRGSISAEQAGQQLADIEEPALIERSQALFAPPSPEQERRIRQRALDSVAPSRRPWWWVTGSLAMAAAFLLVLALRPDDPAPYAPLGVEYRVELSAGWEATRSEADRGPTPGPTPADSPTDSPTYRLDQQVDFTLRPKVALHDPQLEVVMLAYDEQGRSVRVGPRRRLATRMGTVHLSQTLGAAGLTPGTWQLVFVIGRPGQIPEQPERFAPGAPPPDPSVAVVRQTIELVGVDAPRRE